MQQLAFEAGLLDPEVLFRSINFTNFLSVWLIRQADPKKMHPNPIAEYAGIFHFDDYMLISCVKGYPCPRKSRWRSGVCLNTSWRIS